MNEIKSPKYISQVATHDFILYQGPAIHSDTICKVYKGSILKVDLESEGAWVKT